MKKLLIVMVGLMGVCFGGTLLGLLITTQLRQAEIPELFQQCGGSVLEGVCYEHDLVRLTAITTVAVSRNDTQICQQIDFGQGVDRIVTKAESNQQKCQVEVFIAHNKLNECIQIAPDLATSCTTIIAVRRRNVSLCDTLGKTADTLCRWKVLNSPQPRQLFEY